MAEDYRRQNLEAEFRRYGVKSTEELIELFKTNPVLWEQVSDQIYAMQFVNKGMIGRTVKEYLRTLVEIKIR